MGYHTKLQRTQHPYHKRLTKQTPTAPTQNKAKGCSSTSKEIKIRGESCGKRKAPPGWRYLPSPKHMKDTDVPSSSVEFTKQPLPYMDPFDISNFPASNPQDLQVTTWSSRLRPRRNATLLTLKLEDPPRSYPTRRPKRKPKTTKDVVNVDSTHAGSSLLNASLIQTCVDMFFIPKHHTPHDNGNDSPPSSPPLHDEPCGDKDNDYIDIDVILETDTPPPSPTLNPATSYCSPNPKGPKLRRTTMSGHVHRKGIQQQVGPDQCIASPNGIDRGQSSKPSAMNAHPSNQPPIKFEYTTNVTHSASASLRDERMLSFLSINPGGTSMTINRFEAILHALPKDNSGAPAMAIFMSEYRPEKSMERLFEKIAADHGYHLGASPGQPDGGIALLIHNDMVGPTKPQFIVHAPARLISITTPLHADPVFPPTVIAAIYG